MAKERDKIGQGQGLLLIIFSSVEKINSMACQEKTCPFTPHSTLLLQPCCGFNDITGKSCLFFQNYSVIALKNRSL